MFGERDGEKKREGPKMANKQEFPGSDDTEGGLQAQIVFFIYLLG